jgi:hypothetical protein
MSAASADPYSDDVKSVSLEVVRSEPRRKMGRPIVLTVRIFIAICHLVEQGMAISRACESCSVSYGRFRIRVSRSKRLQERLKEAETTRFNLRHEQAIESIMEAGTRSWMAHAWWAERNLQERYAMRAVPRPADTDTEKPAGDLPAERLAHFRALQLELARENEAKAAAKALPSSPASDVEAVG